MKKPPNYVVKEKVSLYITVVKTILSRFYAIVDLP